MTNLTVTALVNSVGVTGCVVVIVCLILRVTSRDSWNATTREAVWWTVLAVAAAMPLLSARSELVSRIRVALASTPEQMEPTAISEGLRRSSDSSAMRRTSEAPDFAGTPASVEIQQGHSLFPLQMRADWWPSYILGAWMAVSMLMLIRLIVSYVQLSRRKSRAVEATELSARAQQWMDSFGTNPRRIRVAISGEVAGPLSTGPFQPTILIPADLYEQLEETELDQISLHEVAHLARRDDYWLLVQRVVEALFVFHPVVRWISRRIDLEREIACDDFVINTTGRPSGYALCLTRLVELCGGVRGTVLGASAAGRRSQLVRRVDMLLNDNCTRATRLLKTRLAAIIFALGLLTFIGAKVPRMLVLTKPALSMPLPVRRQEPAINVTVPVRVTDRLNRYVSGLEQSHFRILEDGVEQQISEFLPAPWGQAGGLSIGIIVNASGATGQDTIAQEVRQSLTRVTDPTDEFFLIRSDAAPLLDVVRMGIDKMRQAQNPRKAIVIVSENAADVPLYDDMEMKGVAASADVPIYSVSVFPTAVSAMLLDDLALNTGGQHFRISDVRDVAQLPDIITKITVAVRNIYVLTFQSTNNVRDGSYRTIKVELLPPKGIQSLRSEHRAGYYAPGQQRN